MLCQVDWVSDYWRGFRDFQNPGVAKIVIVIIATIDDKDKVSK